MIIGRILKVGIGRLDSPWIVLPLDVSELILLDLEEQNAWLILVLVRVVYFIHFPLEPGVDDLDQGELGVFVLLVENEVGQFGHEVRVVYFVAHYLQDFPSNVLHFEFQ